MLEKQMLDPDSRTKHQWKRARSRKIEGNRSEEIFIGSRAESLQDEGFPISLRTGRWYAGGETTC
jgi:hypothetical protein